LAYRIVYKKSIQRDIKKLDKSEASHLLDHIENELSNRPESFPILKGHFAGMRKYRVGNYRVIYVIMGEEIIILRIGDRKEVYKK